MLCNEGLLKLQSLSVGSKKYLQNLMWKLLGRRQLDKQRNWRILQMWTDWSLLEMIPRALRMWPWIGCWKYKKKRENTGMEWDWNQREGEEALKILDYFELWFPLPLKCLKYISICYHRTLMYKQFINSLLHIASLKSVC